VSPSRLDRVLSLSTRELLAHRLNTGHWEGHLSSSALSTATAVTALGIAGRSSSPPPPEIEAGLDWLASHANEDGGWGDTVLSGSNLSTTTLCWAAFNTLPLSRHQSVSANSEQWLTDQVGSVDPETLAPAIIRRYGKDRTFSVPILTHCALAGALGKGREAWRHVIPLPFELAACPHQWFAALRLPVVSYALPALIAIGQARHHHSPSSNPITRVLRNRTAARTLRLLTAIQPGSGGFLEATPLTSFVTMSLAGSGKRDHPVTRKGVQFLLRSIRTDGSWPIDTNLATWVTTLSINALGPEMEQGLKEVAPLRNWLLNQQYREEHPYTHAAPGGWAWTDLPGGVPDADDTSGALLALHRLAATDTVVQQAATLGVEWLLGLQNRDGGIPTFCRGWGALPFDRSSADITAHALRAWAAWHDTVPPRTTVRLRRSLRRAIGFLSSTQATDGAWVPLWFGNQSAVNDENPTYGTARVLQALAEVAAAQSRLSLSRSTTQQLTTAIDKAANWLVTCQNPDGSWGGAPQIEGSIEETALAVEALASLLCHLPGSATSDRREALQRGALRLADRVEDGSWKKPSPIGFYFAKLWYYEELYPLIFTVGALRAVKEWQARGTQAS